MRPNRNTCAHKEFIFILFRSKRHWMFWWKSGGSVLWVCVCVCIGKWSLWFSLCFNLVSYYIWIWIFSWIFLMSSRSVPSSHCTFLSDLFRSLSFLLSFPSLHCIFPRLVLIMICQPPPIHFPTLLSDVIKIFFSHLQERIWWLVVVDWLRGTLCISRSCAHCMLLQYVLLCPCSLQNTHTHTRETHPIRVRLSVAYLVPVDWGSCRHQMMHVSTVDCCTRFSKHTVELSRLWHCQQELNIISLINVVKK